MEDEKKKKFIINFLYGGIILFLIYVIIKYGLGLVTPFLLAFIIAFLLNKPARFLSNKLKVPYKLVGFLLVLLFYSTIGVLISLFAIKLFSYATDLVSKLPFIYEVYILPFLSSLFNDIEQIVFSLDPALVSALNESFYEITQSLGQLISTVSMQTVGAISTYASSLPGLFIKLLLMIISTFFIAGDYDKLTGFVLNQFSDRGRELVIRIKAYIVDTLFVCIRSYALIITITFIELSIGLSIIGVSNAILIAILIAVFDILPVLGTGGIMIPWVIISALRGEYPLAIGLLVVYLVITVIRNIIEPKIVGSQIGLHPIVTLVSMFVGVQLLGVIGLFGFPIIISLLCHLNETGTIKLFK